MVLKLLLIIASISLIVTLSIKGILTNKAESQNAAQEKNSLVEIARRKKAEGRSKVDVPGSIVDYSGADMSLEDSLKTSSVVIAEPIASKSFAIDSKNVRTWYKFRILETLTRKNYQYCYTCPPLLTVPSEMGTANHDEFFLSALGGTLNIEGVEVSVKSAFVPTFEEGTKYLLLISIAPSQVAKLSNGPSGIFRLDEGQNLSPLGNSNSPIQAEVRQRFGLKLGKFKSHIKP